MKTLARSACFLLLVQLLSLSGWCAAKSPSKQKYLLYVGTYTEKQSKGIYVYGYNAASGALTEMGLAAETVNPSFLTVDSKSKYLYAVNEIQKYKDQSSGGVSAFSVDSSTGKLALLNEVPSGGADPCYVSIDKTGKYVLVANYTGGSVAVFPVQTDGTLGAASAFVQHKGSGPNRERQEAAHAHWIETTPDNRFAIAADLGMDELLVYRFNVDNGSLTPNDPPFAKAEPGAGPRHVAVSRDSRFVYSVNELQSSVSAFSYNAASGTLSPLQTVSTLPKDFSGDNDGAEIAIHPNGRFLFASNRGHDSIAVFVVDKTKGTLRLIDNFSVKGRTPRNFVIDPTGSRLLVANQNSGNIVEFRIDQKTGRLTATGEELKVDSPVCLKFMAVN